MSFKILSFIEKRIGKTSLDYVNVSHVFFPVITLKRYDRLNFTAWRRYRLPVIFRPLPLTVSVYVIGDLYMAISWKRYISIEMNPCIKFRSSEDISVNIGL